jgi:hypothetical protein
MTTNISLSYLGMLVTSGGGLAEFSGFISMFSAWLIHKSGGFSSLCFFLTEPFAMTAALYVGGGFLGFLGL